MPERQMITVVQWRAFFEDDSEGTIQLFANPHVARLGFVEELQMHTREGKRVILLSPDYACVYRCDESGVDDDYVAFHGELLYIGQVSEMVVN